MPGAGSVVKYEWPTIALKPPLMRSANVFRQHRLRRRVWHKVQRKSRKIAFHGLIADKSGVRKELVAAVMEALPLAIFQELTTYGDCSIYNLITLKEKITDGTSMDASVEWHGAVKKAVAENWGS